MLSTHFFFFIDINKLFKLQIFVVLDYIVNNIQLIQNLNYVLRV